MSSTLNESIYSSVPSFYLLTQTQALFEFFVTLRVFVLQLRQMATALTDQLEQATARVFGVFMDFEMLDQLIDPGGQKRDLYFRRTGVCRMNLMLFDNGLLFTL